ncbi:hypothetical protein [Euzebya sp.]|uniref:hypothetical protein n=1 Tax=Euzebya sp. TaxID=1971409 RepID=UPI00351947DA
MSERPVGRIRYLPISLGLGLFVGDLATLAVTGQVTVLRLAASALVAVVTYLVASWLVARR